MKRILLISFLLMYGLTSYSQSQLTYSNFYKSFITPTKWYKAKPFEFTTTGPNQIWNVVSFSNKRKAFINIIDSVINKYALARFNVIQPNLQSTHLGDYQKDYFLSDGKNISIVGSTDDNLFSWVYTDSKKLLIFPVNYGDSYTDSFVSFTIKSTHDTVWQRGVRSVKVDGFGKLITKKMKYEHVLRVVAEERSSYFILGKEVSSDYTQDFTWYDTETGKILMYSNKKSKNANEQSSQYFLVSYY